MTQVSQGQQIQSGEASHGPAAHQQLAINEPSIHQELIIDSPSDNDVNEKSAREKFKKTSIASLYKQTIPSEIVPQREENLGTAESSEQVAPRSGDITEDEYRGRPMGKRALEDESINISEHDSGAEFELQPDPPNGHTRKRSRDVRAGEHVKGNGPIYNSRKAPVQEEAEDFAAVDYHPGYSLVHEDHGHELTEHPADLKSEDMSVLLESNHEAASDRFKQSQDQSIEEKRKSEDQEMKDGAYSPRKKRSRDQMDTVADREQKIAATEETKAQRRSEELERADTSLHQGIARSYQISDDVADANSATNIPNDIDADEAKLEAPKATFGTTNMLRPASVSTTSKSVTVPSDGGNSKSKNVSAPRQPTFSSSGFANFASSSGSPFGAVGSTSTSTLPNTSSFAKTPAEVLSAEDIGIRGGSSFVPISKPSQATFGGTQLSTFASAGSKMGSTFGGVPFGGSFGGGFGGSSKLTSFAAPTGDAKLGGINGSVKAMGSSNHDDEDQDGSDTEDEADEDGNKNDETIEADDRFQHQDVDTGEDGEDTIFSSRAKLYAFKENNWKEAGNGIFKLNVVSSDDPEDKHRSSRFIMRAHQTYRVLLNQPAFPQMKMGDQLGSEPAGRTFAFAVIVDGKPIPHMVKFGDVHESKKLYREVIKLQRGASHESAHED